MTTPLFHTTRWLAFAVAVGLTLFTSCHRNTALTSYSNVKARDIVAILDTTSLEFVELKARFKIQADLNGDRRSFTADIRWEKEKRIWMSFSIFGIEGVRVLFTPDSVKLINKLENEYYYGDYASLARLSKVELSFEEIEALLLGRLFGVEYRKPDVRFEKDQVVMTMQDREFDALVHLDRKTISIQQYWISSLIPPRSLEVTLSHYELVGQKRWPTQRAYEIKTGNTYLKVDASSQKIVLNETLEYPFEVHPKYQRIPL